MKETHNQKIVKTLQIKFMPYGEIVKRNEYCQSLPRSVAKLREKLDKSNRDISKGFIGILKFEGKSYKWFERMDGKTKYFHLEEVQQPIISNVVNGQTGLFDKRSLEVV